MTNRVRMLIEQVKQNVSDIKKDPILNALVEKDTLSQLIRNVEDLYTECSESVIDMRHNVDILQEKVMDLEADVDNLRYENDRLNEQLYNS